MSHKEPGQYKYKIAASIIDPQTDDSLVLATNFLPDCLMGHYGFKDEIGDSGPTIHAEIAALAQLPLGVKAQGKGIIVSDPLCPNCMKSVVASGIKDIRISEEGYENGLWYNSVDEAGIPRKRYFDEVSLTLAKKAGVKVSLIDSDTQVIEPLIEASKEDSPVLAAQKPSLIEPFKDIKTLNTLIRKKLQEFDGQSFALAHAYDEKGNSYFVMAFEDYTAGMDEAAAVAIRKIYDDEGQELRYRLMIDPLTHLLATLSKEGLWLKQKSVYVSEIPTSRCIVNAIGAGVLGFAFPQHLQTEGYLVSEKSKTASAALQELSNKSIIDLQYINPLDVGSIIHPEADAEGPQ